MILKKVFIITVLVSCFANSQTDKGPYFATGIRIGDVSQNEAIIWTRLTKNKIRVNDAPLPISLYVHPETGKRHLRETRRDKDGISIENILNRTQRSSDFPSCRAGWTHL